MLQNLLTIYLPHCVAVCRGEQWGDKGLFRVKYGMLGTGSISDTYGLMCSASESDKSLFALQSARRLRVVPTNTPGVFNHTISIRRTPSLSYLADVLNINLQDVLSSNLNALPITKVTRTEDLTDDEVLNRLCVRDKVPFGCISSVKPSNQCRKACAVTRWLLDPKGSLNGITLQLKIPQRFTQLPGGQGDVLTNFGQVAALGKPMQHVRPTVVSVTAQCTDQSCSGNSSVHAHMRVR